MPPSPVASRDVHILRAPVVESSPSCAHGGIQLPLLPSACAAPAAFGPVPVDTLALGTEPRSLGRPEVARNPLVSAAAPIGRHAKRRRKPAFFAGHLLPPDNVPAEISYKVDQRVDNGLPTNISYAVRKRRKGEAMETQAGIVTALGPNDSDDGDAGRQMRGMTIAALGGVTPNRIGYSVASQSGNGKYVVTIGEDESSVFCSCSDFEKRERACKHIHAVLFSLKRDSRAQRQVAVTGTVRPTYPQNWPAYNMAQTHEAELFERLLRDLCDTIEQPDQHMGRPRLRLSDMVYSEALKVYRQSTGRRIIPDLRGASREERLTQVPSPGSIFRYMEKPELKPLLRGLIERSALPFAALEQVFALDSSGFSSSVYSRWLDHKHGGNKVQRKEQRWTKAHLMCGVLSNIVTTCDVTETPTHDSIYLQEFLAITNQHFVVREVLGDKGYLTKKNVRGIYTAGATPYIPFKTNSVAFSINHGRDDLWQRAFHYYHLNREEFLVHYHQRSNVETVFHMIKTKFGGAVRSKNPAARVNETLSKIFCHNICVLVQSIFELGIEPVFVPRTLDLELPVMS